MKRKESKTLSSWQYLDFSLETSRCHNVRHCTIKLYTSTYYFISNNYIIIFLFWHSSTILPRIKARDNCGSRLKCSITSLYRSIQERWKLHVNLHFFATWRKSRRPMTGPNDFASGIAVRPTINNDYYQEQQGRKNSSHNGYLSWIWHEIFRQSPSAVIKKQQQRETKIKKKTCSEWGSWPQPKFKEKLNMDATSPKKQDGNSELDSGDEFAFKFSKWSPSQDLIHASDSI